MQSARNALRQSAVVDLVLDTLRDAIRTECAEAKKLATGGIVDGADAIRTECAEAKERIENGGLSITDAIRTECAEAKHACLDAVECMQ